MTNNIDSNGEFATAAAGQTEMLQSVSKHPQSALAEYGEAQHNLLFHWVSNPNEGQLG